jgi:3'-phosphoadenosine 5'-phosphosulfate sulfotransferase (PAPS reductase)/FAD synthetase
MKKKPFKLYAEQHEIEGYLTGMRMSEGGARAFAYETAIKAGKAPCTTIKGKYTVKSPLIDWTDEMCDLFVKRYNVPLSKAYTDYGLTRTGCFCCPFAPDIDSNLENLFRNEPNRYKAALFYLKDVYIAQGVELPFDDEYMAEYTEKWKEYEVMRYEMLKKYRPNCRLVQQYEKSQEQPEYTQLALDMG